MYDTLEKRLTAAGQRTTKHKAALTRANRNDDPIARKDAVIAVCRKAVREWNEIGAWPDNWSLFQRALSDALLGARLVGDNASHVGVNQLADLA